MTGATAPQLPPVESGEPPRIRTLTQLAGGEDWRLRLLHDRPHHLFVWLTRGQGIAILDGLRSGIGTHNALFIPAHHLMSLDPGKQGFGLALTIPATGSRDLPEMVRQLRLRDALMQGELSGLLDAIQREQDATRPMAQAAIQAHIDLLAIWLHRAGAADPDRAKAETAAQRLVRAFCQSVTARYRVATTVADYAAELGVTATHLSRSCQMTCGMGAVQIINQRRLYAARVALSQPDTSITAIAAELGFSGTPYFTRFIQQHTGMTPGRLRQKARTQIPSPQRP